MSRPSTPTCRTMPLPHPTLHWVKSGPCFCPGRPAHTVRGRRGNHESPLTSRDGGRAEYRGG